MCSAFPSPVIQTARLNLRAPTAADAPRIAELCGDFDIPRMTTRMPWPYGVSDAEAFIEAVQKQDHSQETTLVMDLPDEGVVGCVGLFTPARLPEIGYWIGRPYWGRGFATEAAKGALVWARTDWGKKAVMAGHFADNPASGAVLSKVGFLYTGEVQLKHSIARARPAATRMMVWIA